MPDEPRGDDPIEPLDRAGVPLGSFDDHLIERLATLVTSEIGASRNSLVDRLYASHITKILDQSVEAEKRAGAIQVQALWIGLIALIFGLVLIGFVIHQFLLLEKGDLMREILALLIGLCGGGTIGFGAGRITTSRPAR